MINKKVAYLSLSIVSCVVCLPAQAVVYLKAMPDKKSVGLIALALKHGIREADPNCPAEKILPPDEWHITLGNGFLPNIAYDAGTNSFMNNGQPIKREPLMRQLCGLYWENHTAEEFTITGAHPNYGRWAVLTLNGEGVDRPHISYYRAGTEACRVKAQNTLRYEKTLHNKPIRTDRVVAEINYGNGESVSFELDEQVCKRYKSTH